jgi:ABC transporter DrrB family efflux protein
MSRLVSAGGTFATAHRVLAQLRGDRRTMALLLIVPSVLLILLNRMFDSQPDFDRVALTLLGIFPFTTMFLITSVAMLRERTSGTLERLLTTPISKLDLLLGYGIAFAVAAAAQAVVTCATVYLLLNLYTPGSPLLVIVIAILTAVLGMSLGLLFSAFATTEFQAVQFMPAVVMPQILLGGLFVPRAQMADWLESISDVLPLTYSIDAMEEVGSSGIVSDELLRDVGVVVGAAILALALAAATLRRRTGTMSRATRRALVAVPLVGVTVVGVAAATDVVAASQYVRTENAQIDGDRIPLIAPVAGTLVDWRATLGSAVRKDQSVGRIQVQDGFAQAQRQIRAPSTGNVVLDNAVEGAFVTAGTQLAIAYDLADVYVTARVDETSIDGVQVGQFVEIDVDAYPDVPLTGRVAEIRRGVDGLVLDTAANNTGRFQKITRVVPVKVAISDRRDLALVPGMSVTVRIRRH